jgi:hypothetical protein
MHPVSAAVDPTEAHQAQAPISQISNISSSRGNSGSIGSSGSSGSSDSSASPASCAWSGAAAGAGARVGTGGGAGQVCTLPTGAVTDERVVAAEAPQPEPIPNGGPAPVGGWGVTATPTWRWRRWTGLGVRSSSHSEGRAGRSWTEKEASLLQLKRAHTRRAKETDANSEWKAAHVLAQDTRTALLNGGLTQ